MVFFPTKKNVAKHRKVRGGKRTPIDNYFGFLLTPESRLMITLDTNHIVPWYQKSEKAVRQVAELLMCAGLLLELIIKALVEYQTSSFGWLKLFWNVKNNCFSQQVQISKMNWLGWKFDSSTRWTLILLIWPLLFPIYFYSVITNTNI